MVKTLSACALTAGLVLAPLAQAGEAAIRGPWVRLMPTAASGGYFALHNGTSRTLRLTGASSEAFGKVMLHRTVEEGGTSRMEHVSMVAVPSGEEHAFAPGGYHLMLMEPTRELQVGDTVRIRLHFRDHPTRSAAFPVRPAYARGP